MTELPSPPSESQILASEYRALTRSWLTRWSGFFTLTTLVILPLVTTWELIWPVKLAIGGVFSAALAYQIVILACSRATRRVRVWRDWQKKRALYFRGRVEVLAANGALAHRKAMEQLLVIRHQISSLLARKSLIPDEEQLSYLLGFDQLADLALNGLEQRAEGEPLFEVLALGEQLVAEIPLAIAVEEDDDYSDEEFTRSLADFRQQHQVRIGVARRIRQALGKESTL
ncbi:hypothetical protein [Roseibacillus ishigakijimensis]|uniref:Uncharacterized protein n=1 Tax=Roseibacillus ishigakijimensis TaxID=454146 RepID=A0A934RNA2_9BACT|nr:hypothetical protein [Roseibacillus ishigakijimensis]MBK1832511.1 hypothetical protein [Roseibacillus ishigakijimensis]